MKKILSTLILLILALSACNLPATGMTQPAISLEQQAATVVAQTLTAVALENNVPLPSPTAGVPEQPLASPTAAGETPTLQPSATAPGTATATTLTVDSNTNCREGPGTSFAVVIVLTPGITYQIIARSQDNKYWVVTEIGKANTCWVPAEMSNAFGDVTLLPVTTPSAPTSAAGPLQPPAALAYRYSCVYNGVNSDITVTLTWTDRSNNEDGFRVYRDGALVETLPANATYFTEMFTGYATIFYSYRVSAFNAAGEALGGTVTFSCSQ